MIAFVCSLFVAVFIVEFAPDPLRRVLEPVVRLLASVPSVIYGLVGVFVLVPFIGNHLITQGSKASVPGDRHAQRLRPAGRRGDPHRDDRSGDGGRLL